MYWNSLEITSKWKTCKVVLKRDCGFAKKGSEGAVFKIRRSLSKVKKKKPRADDHIGNSIQSLPSPYAFLESQRFLAGTKLNHEESIPIDAPLFDSGQHDNKVCFYFIKHMSTFVYRRPLGKC